MNDTEPSDAFGTLALYLTWVTYGSWLPGDPRGWRRRGDPKRYQYDPAVLSRARERQRDPTVTFTPAQRAIAREAIEASCVKRTWPVHACAVRSQHIHLVVSPTMAPAQALIALKGEATRALREIWPELDGRRIWARHGNLWRLYSTTAVDGAVTYVLDDHHR